MSLPQYLCRVTAVTIIQGGVTIFYTRVSHVLRIKGRYNEWVIRHIRAHSRGVVFTHSSKILNTMWLTYCHKNIFTKIYPPLHQTQQKLNKIPQTIKTTYNNYYLL